MTTLETLTLAHRAKLHVLITGRPGVGKSMLPRLLAQELGQTAIPYTMPEDSASATLSGHYIPSGQGSFVWHDGPTMRAYRHGHILIADELSHLSPEGTTFMHAVLDSTPGIELPSGERVERHPDFWCCATQNDAATRLRPAIRDRFAVTLELEHPIPEAYLGLPAWLRMPARMQVEGDKGSLRPWYALSHILKTQDLGPKSDLAPVADLLWPGRGQEFVTAIRLAK